MRKDKLFTLCASSNLLEPNACWNKLKETCNLSFESYGEFISPLLKKYITDESFFQNLISRQSEIDQVFEEEGVTTNVNTDQAV